MLWSSPFLSQASFESHLGPWICSSLFLVPGRKEYFLFVPCLLALELGTARSANSRSVGYVTCYPAVPFLFFFYLLSAFPVLISLLDLGTAKYTSFSHSPQHLWARLGCEISLLPLSYSLILCLLPERSNLLILSVAGIILSPRLLIFMPSSLPMATLYFPCGRPSLSQRFPLLVCLSWHWYLYFPWKYSSGLNQC